MKRSSPTGSEDSQPDAEDIETKRKKLCEFESVRLPAVAGVNDIDEKKSRVQVYKLSETVRFKDKIIAQKNSELEQLRQRQYTDENTSYTINRYWNNLDEQLRNIVLRGSNPSDVNQLLETNGDASSSFLEEIVQMNEEERQKTYDKRVNTSVRLVQQIVQANIQKTEQLKGFMNKMSSFMSEKGSREDTMNELVHQNALLADENARLTKDCSKLHHKYSDCKLKLREATDKVSNLETKVEEQTKDLNDLKHDLDKANRMVNKLDYKLWSEIRERRSKAVSISEPVALGTTSTAKINGTTDYPGDLLVDNEANGCSSKQVEELRSEVESATELAASRLNEINELHEKLRKKSEELELVSLRIENHSDDQDSALTKELRMFLTMAIEELQKKTTHEVSLIEETDLIRVELGNCEESLKAHYDRAMAVFQEINTGLETENEELREEVDQLVHELEENRITLINAGIPEHKDIRTLKESYKAQINQLKSEATRMRKKWKDTVNVLLKNSKELDVERKKNENFYLVPIVPMDEVTEDGIDSALQERFVQLRKENLGLRAEIQRLRELDDTTRKIVFEAEFKEKLAEKDMKIMHLTGQIDSLTQGDESITQEMESIGQALEDLQEQNGDLIRRSGHHEEERMKMMGDKIASKQLEIKLKEETAQWETKAEQYKHQVHCTQLERQYFEEAYKAFNTLVNCRSREAALVRSTVEILRKQTLEKAVELSQLKNDKEKLAAQVKSVQDTIFSKNRQHDLLAQKLRRLEEENSLARKQLDRAKLSEKLGSTDAVMSEENRQLKEALTCPSCKVNRKDAILTKCFHVFCMDCLKTRYETRQRKCPKCNAGFGANDFQRAYIG